MQNTDTMQKYKILTNVNSTI